MTYNTVGNVFDSSWSIGDWQDPLTFTVFNQQSGSHFTGTGAIRQLGANTFTQPLLEWTGTPGVEPVQPPADQATIDCLGDLSYRGWKYRTGQLFLEYGHASSDPWAIGYGICPTDAAMATIDTLPSPDQPRFDPATMSGFSNTFRASGEYSLTYGHFTPAFFAGPRYLMYTVGRQDRNALDLTYASSVDYLNTINPPPGLPTEVAIEYETTSSGWLTEIVSASLTAGDAPALTATSTSEFQPGTMGVYSVDPSHWIVRNSTGGPVTNSAWVPLSTVASLPRVTGVYGDSGTYVTDITSYAQSQDTATQLVVGGQPYYRWQEYHCVLDEFLNETPITVPGTFPTSLPSSVVSYQTGYVASLRLFRFDFTMRTGRWRIRYKLPYDLSGAQGNVFAQFWRSRA